MEQTGTLENLTPSQKQIKQKITHFIKIENNQTDPRWTDWYILRFCRARKFDLPKIKQMLKNYFSWATKVNLSKIGSLDLKKYANLRNWTRNGYLNTDKRGRPVYYDQIRFLKAKEMFKSYSEAELVQYWIQSYERLLNVIMVECSRVNKRRVDRTVTILDLKGVSLFSMFGGRVKAFSKLATEIAQNYYPEVMGKMYIINTGYFFKGLWAIVKPWIDPVTLKKISIHSGSGKEELLEDIGAENLHVSCGGKCEIDVREDFGPWSEALKKSKRDGNIFHHDQDLVFEYFFSEEEKKRALGRKESAKLN